MSDINRDYLKTHGFIQFVLDFNRLGHVTWMMLGEAKAFVNRVCNIPLPPHVAKEFGVLYLSRGVNATTAIEGNSLSEAEVRAILEDRSKVPPSRQYLEQEVKNVADAFHWAHTTAFAQPHSSICPEFIKNLNQRILEKMDPKEGVVPGEFRQCSVGVGSYLAPPWQDCEYLVDELCRFTNQQLGAADGLGEMAFAVKVCVAITAHVLFEWIHPFGDGNGRTGRLLESTILLEAGVPDLSIHLLTNFYNKTKPRYIEKLQEATRRGVEVFLTYAIEGFRDELVEQMETITEFQINLTWVSFIESIFRNHNKTSDLRKKQLALRLELDRGIPFGQLYDTLARDLYLGKTQRTLRRDLDALEEKGVATRDEQDGYMADLRSILRFLPNQKVPLLHQARG